MTTGNVLTQFVIPISKIKSGFGFPVCPQQVTFSCTGRSPTSWRSENACFSFISGPVWGFSEIVARICWACTFKIFMDNLCQLTPLQDLSSANEYAEFLCYESAIPKPEIRLTDALDCYSTFSCHQAFSISCVLWIIFTFRVWNCYI